MEDKIEDGKISHQDRGNMLNGWIKQVHGECIMPGCGKPITGKNGAYHHVYQKNKGGRPAELAKGSLDKLLQEYEYVLPLCASCHNRLVRSITSTEMKFLERTLRCWNSKHNGHQYRIGIRLELLEVAKWLHDAGVRIKVPDSEYDIIMKNFTWIARRQKPEAA